MTDIIPLDTREIKQKLEKERKRLKESLTSLSSQDPFTDPERVNDNAASDTEASEESSHERMEALKKELETHLTATEETLLRLQDGTYGLCVSCGRQIDPERLRVNPTAEYCIHCERSKEK